MARTFPRTLLDEDIKSKAERKVFEALRDQLSDDWSIFHSASVIYRDHAEGARDDEGDFVLCHPERAIVCLEVKGGGLECRHGEWFRRPAGSGPERIRDPFGQALDHRYALKRKIAEVEGWEGRELALVHALAFPDISVHQLVLAPDAPREILLDRNDLPDVATAVERVLAYHKGSRDSRVAPGPEAEAMLERLLAPTFRIDVPMATLFEEEERALVKLTERLETGLRTAVDVDGEQVSLLSFWVPVGRGKTTRLVMKGPGTSPGVGSRYLTWIPVVGDRCPYAFSC